VKERLKDDFGLVFKWSDLPFGIAIGLFSQYVLALVLELPLYPFVPHLFHRLSAPAHSLTAGESGIDLALIGVLVCVGSPFVEELFFRGLFLRGLLGVARDRLSWSAVPAVLASAGVCGVVFGLVHFEALELLALSGFGVVLALVACATGRLGPGIVAHVTFNALTFIALAFSH
jgi:membrane protease YdiL (CAAX protease family)